MTKGEFESICDKVKTLFPPKGIKTIFNGEELKYQKPLVKFVEILPTETCDSTGNLKPTRRKSEVHVHLPESGKGWIYEMGIPVVETDDKYHVDVQQKIPLNIDRDNVTPSYLKTVRTFVFNYTFNLLDEDEATDTWVKEALGDDRCGEEALDRQEAASAWLRIREKGGSCVTSSVHACCSW